MSRTLTDLRPVHVVGIGLHPYQAPGTQPYTELGLTAVRAALDDAGIGWPEVETAFVGTALVAAASGRPMLRHLGATGTSITHVENASASRSSADESSARPTRLRLRAPSSSTNPSPSASGPAPTRSARRCYLADANTRSSSASCRP